MPKVRLGVPPSLRLDRMYFYLMYSLHVVFWFFQGEMGCCLRGALGLEGKVGA
jgi:hypothetical protein